MPATTTRRRLARTASDAIEDASQHPRRTHEEPLEEDDDVDDVDMQETRAVKSERAAASSSSRSKAADDTNDIPFDVDNFPNQALDRSTISKLKSSATDWESVAKSLQRNGFGLITEVAISMAEYGEGDEAQKALLQLDLVFRDLLDAKQEVEIHSKVLQDLSQKVVLGEVDDVEEQWERDIKSAIETYSAKTARQKYAKEEPYLTHKNRIFEVKNPGEAMPPITYFIPKEDGDDSDEDDDVEVGGVTQEYKCPITLMPLVQPLTAPCGHSFSADAIKGYLSNNRNASKKCPATGCNGWVKLGELTEDKELAKRANDHARRLARAEAEEEDEEVIE